MERYKHIKLYPTVRKKLLKISASSIDRLLLDVRKKANPNKRKRKASKKVSKQISVRTFADWDDPEPGYLEVDFVAHSGGSMAGNFIHALVGTDVSSGWTECIPLVAREQSLVVEGIELLRSQFPFPVLGLDFDNDSAFINDTLFDYCKTHSIKITRSRPFRKNDQAWVEQKNSAVVRRFAGYERFAGFIAGSGSCPIVSTCKTLCKLFSTFFQVSKQRETRFKDAQIL